MLWGILFIIIGLVGLVGTERVRRNPELLRKGYMVRFTSIVLLIYATRQSNEELCNTLAENASIRKKYLIETYIYGAIGLISGVTLLILNR
jgi:hypothetical protein